MDPGTAQAIAGASGAMSLLAALQELALTLLGVPLGVPLAGFAGACYGASFREPRAPAVFWRSVITTAAISSIICPLVAHWMGVDVRYFAPVAAVLAWVLEWGAPWLKANGPRLANDLWARLVGRPAPLAPPMPRDPEATLPPKRGTPGDES